MKKGNRLSHSSVQMYSVCGRKYDLHYNKRWRSKYESGALVFGRCLDISLNHLLTSKNLEESIALFEKSFRYQFINNVGTYIPTSTHIVYANRDFDKDLIIDEDRHKYAEYKVKQGIQSDTVLEDEYQLIQEKKQSQGFKSLEEFEKSLYAYSNWLSMRHKGLIMLQSYHDKVLPNIKEVLEVQKKISLDNPEGDSIVGVLDLVVVWKDGKRYLLDNKTSSIEYEEDAAMKSQQLILYYHAGKEEYVLDGVGFIVLSKQIMKNKKKVCKSCSYIGTSTHKTCNNEVEGKRCGGEWDVTLDPECYISFILNEVPEAAEDLVLQTFDEANEGIKKQVYNPNLLGCMQWGSKCAYYEYCWSGKKDDIVELGVKDEEKTK